MAGFQLSIIGRFWVSTEGIVSERLGHSNIAITLDVYSHVLPDMQDEAARRIDIALRAAMNDQK